MRDSSGTLDRLSFDEVLLMGQRFRIRVFGVLLFFVFCQTAGVMCALPHVFMVDDGVAIADAGMTCPMDASMTCPPLITSSADRQIKYSSSLNPVNSPLLGERPYAVVTTSVAGASSLNRSHPCVLALSACLQVLRI